MNRAMAKFGIVPHVPPKKPDCPASKAPVEPVPRDQWPTWATLVAKKAGEGERGVGDTVAKLTGKGGAAYIALREKLKLPCRCKERHADWNARYPYPPPPA